MKYPVSRPHPYLLLHAMWTFDIEQTPSWEQGCHTYRLLFAYKRGKNVALMASTVISNIKINRPRVYFANFYRTRIQEFNLCGLSVWFVIQFTRDTPMIMYLYIVCALIYMYVKCSYSITFHSGPCAVQAKEAMDLEPWAGDQVGPDCKLSSRMLYGRLCDDRTRVLLVYFYM